MTPTATTMTPNARQWGLMWGARPRDWALNEEQQAPVYQDVIDIIRLRSGDRVLDVGCGTGVFLRMCADRGAAVSGIDAAEGLLALAAERVPEAELCHGDMQCLPYEDDSFDAVTGFTSFFFADDMVAALSEAGRVVRPGGPVAIQAFGDPTRCDLETVKAVVMAFRPPERQEREYWRPGVVEELVAEAGLELDIVFDSTFSYVYPDDSAFADAMLSAGGAALAAGDREPELRAALIEALAHRHQADGSYRLSNEWHTVIARA
jgi:SAM-dependent methyltransferase